MHTDAVCQASSGIFTGSNSWGETVSEPFFNTKVNINILHNLNAKQPY